MVDPKDEHSPSRHRASREDSARSQAIVARKPDPADSADEDLEREAAIRRALDGSEDRNRQLFERTPLPILLFDAETLQIVDANPAAERFYGYPRSEFTALSMEDLQPPEDVPLFLGRLAQSPDGTVRALQTRHLKRDGTLAEVEVTSHPVVLRGRVARFTIIQDVTERTRYQATLEANEAQFRQLTENICEVYWIQQIDPPRLLYVSPSYEEIWGRPVAEAYADPYSFIEGIHPDDRAQMLKAVVEEGLRTRSDLEFRVVRPDGSIRWVSSRSYPVEDAQGRIYRNVGVAEDVTESRRAQERLAIQLEVARALTEAESLADGGPRILEAVCRTLGFQWGAIWTVDGEPRRLSCREIWTAPGMDLLRFREATAQFTPGLGEGLPGEVWQTRTARWVPDMGTSEYRRAPVAHEVGLVSALAFPIACAGEVVGVLEFMDRSRREPDLDLLAVLSGVGRQIGQFVARRQAEESLRLSEARFRALIEKIHDVIALMSPGGRCSYVSPGITAILGYAPEEFVGTDVMSYVHPDDLRDASTSLAQIMAAPAATSSVEIRMRHRDGSYRSIRNSGVNRIDDPAIAAVVASLHDTTRFRDAEDRWRRLAAIVESSDDAILATDLDGKISSWNSGAEELFGYRREEIVGRNVEILEPPERAGEIGRIFDGMSRGERVHRLETMRLHKNRGLLHVSLTVSPIHDSAGRVLGASAIARDISGRRLLEDQLRQAQKMEAVGRLAGGVAHDFNNLLTAILGYSHVAQARAAGDPVLVRHLDEIRKAGERAANLTRQLLAFSRKQVLVPAELDLGVVVGDMTSMLARLIGEDIHLSTTIQPGLSRIHADRGQIEQVILNLVVNSRDAMPDGGELVLTGNDVELDGAYALDHAGVPPGRYVMLAVSDTGCGMDETVKSRLFEPFFTTKEPGKGTGLGLATVYGIVRQSDGHIYVYSEPGHGTTFKIYLPARDPAPAKPAPASLGDWRGSGEVILLVEDDLVVRNLVQGVLVDAGYRVLVPPSSTDAVATLERSEQPIQLLLTDVVMPGKAGREVAQDVSAKQPGVRVLFMSGYTDDMIVRHGAGLGEVPFLQKPFTPRGLLQKVRAVLDHGGLATTPS